jgi:phosphatidylserine/phosphatidylglycerophosphate/cardiolipin synthase-like enzyme
MAAIQPTYQLFEYADQFFSSMVHDIRNARKYIYLQMYKFSGGEAGKIFRDELTRKA